MAISIRFYLCFHPKAHRITRRQAHLAATVILLLGVSGLAQTTELEAATGDKTTLVASASLTTRQTTHQLGYFDLPSQPLQVGLVEFALQAGVNVVANHKLISAHRSSPVVGPQNIATALGQLLANAPLSYSYVAASDTYVIFEKAPNTAQHTSSENPREILDHPYIDEVLVFGSRYPTRYSTITHSQAHGEVAYFDEARFLNVLPRQLLDDQQPLDLGDTLKYASAITSNDGVADSNDDVSVRGFRRHATYLDGFRLSSTTGIKLISAGVERVEILKGPATLHYGQAEPGGIVNVVRKKPRKDDFLQLYLETGSFQHNEISIDANSQIPNTANAFVRLIAAQDRQRESSDIRDLYNQLLSLGLAWQLSSDTEVSVGYELKRAGLEQNRDIDVLRPYGDNFSGATLADSSKQLRPDFSAIADFFSLELSHYLSPAWRFNAGYYWHDERRSGVRNTAEAMLETDLFFHPGEWGGDYLVLIPGGQTTIPIIIDTQSPELRYRIGTIRNLYDEQAFDTATNIKLNLEGSFDTAGFTHRLTLGGDWHRQEMHKRYLIESRIPYAYQDWSEAEFSAEFIDIANALFDPARDLGQINTQERHLLYDDLALFFQDNIKLNDRWIVSLGTRYSLIDGEHTNTTAGLVTPLSRYSNFSSQAGVVFQPSANHALYLNYSEAVRANYHIDDIGSKAAAPELSNQVELGLKSQIFKGKFTTSAAIYSIDKNNIVDLAIVDGVRTATLSSQQQVTGFDLDFTAELGSRLNVIGAVAFMSAEIVSGVYAGNHPAMAPSSTASLFAHFNLSSSLALNGGVKYVGKRYADNGNAFYLGWYSSYDLGAQYQFNLLEAKPLLRVSAKNLFDTDYYTAIVGGVRENFAQGRSIDLSIEVNF